MARNTREVITELYRVLNTRDVSAALTVCHPEIEWHWPETTPETRVFRGLPEVRSGLDTWSESWAELVLEAGEMFEEGDYVLVMTTYRMRGMGSGLYLEHEVAHLHQLEEGLVRRWWMFGDTEKARRRFLEGDRPAGRP